MPRGLPRTEGRNGAAAFDESRSKWKVNGNPFREAREAGVFVTRVGGFSCRGYLTQTEGRDDAETTGEGRPNGTISVKLKEAHCDLQATASPRRLKRRQPRVRCAAFRGRA